MRLPWPLSLIQRAPAPPASRDAGAASAAGRNTLVHNDGPVFGATKHDRGEWRQVPPILEIVGPPPLIAPNAPFAAELGAGHAPPPILAPLGHGRGLDAPAGLAVGIARPVQRASASPSRPLVQRRRTEPDQPTPQLDLDVVEPGPEVAPSSPQPVDPAAVAPAIVPRRVAPATTAPIQRAPLRLARVGEREQATLASARVTGMIGQPRAATGSVAQSLAPAPAPVPASVPAPTPAAEAKQPPSPAPLTLHGPIARKPQGSSVAPLTPIPSPGLPGRMTLGQSRKVGLGAPLAAAPVTSAPLGPETLRPPALPMSAPIQRKPAQSEAAAPKTSDRADEPTALSSAPVKARPIAAPVREHPPVAAAPLVSATTLRGGVQRASLTASARRGKRAHDDAPAVSGSPVKVHRGDAVGELADALQAKAFTHQGEIYLPPSAGPIGSPSARSLVAHEMTHVAQQRAYGSRLPLEHSSRGQDLERQAAAAEHHGPQMPLATPPNRPGRATENADDLASAQRKPVNGSSKPSVETTTINFPAPVQRAAADKAKSEPAKPSTEPAAKTDTELEELAGQLYARISRRLRRELLVDRERSGVMVDLR